MKANVEAGKTPEEILAAIAALKNELPDEKCAMQNKMTFPALDASVVIDGDTVTITNDDGEAIQVGIVLRREINEGEISEQNEGKREVKPCRARQRVIT